MDLSDGLSFSLEEIGRKSGVGFRVYTERIPVDSGLQEISGRLGVSAEDMTLHGAGDFELLFTAPKGAFRSVEKEINAAAIGEVTKEGAFLQKNGEEIKLKSEGYEAFLANI